MRRGNRLLFLAFAVLALHGCAAPMQAKGPEGGTSEIALHGGGGAANADRLQQDIEQATTSLQGVVLERQENSVLLTIRSDELFEPEAAVLKPASEARIGIIAAILNRSVQACVTVHCHTDSTGSEQTNLILSEERARMVKEALSAKGLPPARLTALGHGESQQLTSNATENGRQINRRITLEINPLQP